MINIYWKTGVGRDAINAVIEGTKRFASLVSFSERNIRICGDDIRVNRYARDLPRIRGMFDAGAMNSFLNKLNREDVSIFINDEMLCNDGSFLLGLTRGFGITVSSSSVRNPKTLAELTMHELGHAHGMTYYGRPHTEYSFGSHCTVPHCLMKQSYGIDDFEHHAADCRQYGWFCETCIAEARKANKRKAWYQTPSLPPRRDLTPSLADK